MLTCGVLEPKLELYRSGIAFVFENYELWFFSFHCTGLA